MLKILKRKSKKDTTYFALVYDNGFETLTLTFDRYIITAITGLSLKALNEYFEKGNEEYFI